MSTTSAQEQTTKIITGLVRFSYFNGWEPKKNDDGKEKYGLSIIISKDDKVTLDKINAAVESAKQIGKDKNWKGKIPGLLKLPLRDGDAERPEDPAYANSYFLNANSDRAPGIVGTEKDKDGKPKEITDRSLVYSGCYGRVSINFYPFDGKQNGVAAGLQGIQKVKDGEPLSGGSNAKEDFNDDFSIEDDEDLM